MENYVKHILLVFYILIFFTGCMIIKDGKKKDDRPSLNKVKTENKCCKK